jgi:DNA recombination protein RmuC
MANLAVLLAGLAALAAVVGLWLVAGQVRTLERLRLTGEQALAATRAEAETTRAELRMLAASSSDRMATLQSGVQLGLEQMRASLAREQGELRLGLAETQGRWDEQTINRFEAIRGIIETRLQELRDSNAARLSEIQKAVNEQLHAAVEKQMQDSFNRVIDQFAAVQKAMGDVQAVTAQIGDIKRLFSNVKTRGGWGETQVRAILDDILPPGAYVPNCRIRPDSDEVVEFAVIMPVRGEARPLLAIDAKFPVEDYERLLAASDVGDADAERAAARSLDRRVRDEARKIAAKYILPPTTVEFAVLYLPTDALYTEVARIPGLIDEIGRECRVLLVGPTLFPALLRTIHLGFVTLALEQKADQIRELLGATRTEMLRMDEVLERLAKQAGAFSNTIERARVRTRAVRRKLRGVEAVEPDRAELLLETEPDGLSMEIDDLSGGLEG